MQSIYIHWPFCPYRCHFCPFVALAGQDQFMLQYHESLKKEILLYNRSYLDKTSLKTIFLGGGTPSTYPNHLLLDTFGILKNVFLWESEIEVSIEVNPGTVKQGQLEVWKQIGINRLSIGVQSLNSTVLKSLNRHHSTEDVVNLLDYASKLFENISIDLIIGLPGVGPEQWKETINTVVNWPIKHMSIYFLTVHEDTPLYFGVKQNRIILPPDNQVVDLYYWSVQKLKENGFLQYEISNFAKSDFQSKHNSAYWDRTPYKGFGLGACSFDGAFRTQNEKNLLKYMDLIEQENDPVFFSEKLTAQQIWIEELMLGLRRSKGVRFEKLLALISENKKEDFVIRVNELVKEGFLCIKDDHIVLTAKGLSVENEVVLRISA